MILHSVQKAPDIMFSLGLACIGDIRHHILLSAFLSIHLKFNRNRHEQKKYTYTLS